MPDYNIYIHSADTTNQTSPTKAWTTDTDSPTKSWQQVFAKGINYAQNPDALVSAGVGFLSKAIPAIAIARLVVNLVDKVITTAVDQYAVDTGDHRRSFLWGNFKANVGVIFRPFGTSFNELKAQRRYAIEDDRRRMNRELLGDSVINSYTNRGV